MRDSAPPIPYAVSLLHSSDDWGVPINQHIEDWRLDLDFTRSVPAVLWLRFKGGFTFDPARDLIHVTSGADPDMRTRLTVTLIPVLAATPNETTAYEVESYRRANHRFLRNETLVISAGISVTDAAESLRDVWQRQVDNLRRREKGKAAEIEEAAPIE